jgi:FlaG/FlaF family flagellin (archaellin)
VRVQRTRRGRHNGSVRRRASVVAIVVPLAGVIATGVAAASPQASGSPPGINLTGCAGNGHSSDANGRLIQSARAPNPPASSSHPLTVDPNGTVSYSGHTDSVITNHHWYVDVFGIQVKSGGSRNGTHQTSRHGTVKVSSYLPFKITGLMFVKGGISGTGGSCSGSMWIKLTGSPTATVPWFIGIVLTLSGLAGLYFSRPTVTA